MNHANSCADKNNSKKQKNKLIRREKGRMTDISMTNSFNVETEQWNIDGADV